MFNKAKAYEFPPDSLTISHLEASSDVSSRPEHYILAQFNTHLPLKRKKVFLR